MASSDQCFHHESFDSSEVTSDNSQAVIPALKNLVHTPIKSCTSSNKRPFSKLSPAIEKSENNEKDIAIKQSVKSAMTAMIPSIVNCSNPLQGEELYTPMGFFCSVNFECELGVVSGIIKKPLQRRIWN